MSTSEKPRKGSASPGPSAIEGLEHVEELEERAEPDIIVWGQLAAVVQGR